MCSGLTRIHRMSRALWEISLPPPHHHLPFLPIWQEPETGWGKSKVRLPGPFGAGTGGGGWRAGLEREGGEVQEKKGSFS